jgi:hypothetical protein
MLGPQLSMPKVGIHDFSTKKIYLMENNVLRSCLKNIHENSTDSTRN